MGTLISGTMRTVDLVPAFLDELERCDRAAYGAIEAEYLDRINAIREHTAGSDPLDIAETEEDGWLLEALFDALNAAAPEGCYFGSAEGDGADYGYWSVGDGL